MTDTAPALTILVLQSLVVGALGGAGLVVAHMSSRHSASIFPVYAAVLVVLMLLLFRHHGLSFAGRFATVFTGTITATAILLLAVIAISRRERRRQGQTTGEHLATVARGGAPIWGAPLVLLLLVLASAAIAFIAG